MLLNADILPLRYLKFTSERVKNSGLGYCILVFHPRPKSSLPYGAYIKITEVLYVKP